VTSVDKLDVRSTLASGTGGPRLPPEGPHLFTCSQSALCCSSPGQDSQAGTRPRYPDRRDPISLRNPAGQAWDPERERGSQHPAILTVLLAPGRIADALAKPLERMLLHEAADPNRSRDLLLDRVQNGTVWGLP
jgi:hypothetical protein